LPKRWISQLLALGAWLLAAGGGGLWFGQPAWWLVGALALWLAATLYKLYDLDKALHGELAHPTVDTTGLWAELLGRVGRYRQKASERKKKYHRLLREVRESTGALRDAGIILNDQHEIQWFNPAAGQLLGLETEKGQRQRIDDLLPDPDFVAYLHSDDDREIQIPSPRESGEQLAVQILPYGRQQRLVILRDVTREYLLERMRRDFVANASHELRSPLTVLSGYLDTMVEDAEIPLAWRGPLDEMQRQSSRMANIIRDLLELSRLEATDSDANRKVVDVGAVLRHIQTEFTEETAHLSLVFEVDEEISLLGDETQLHSVFFNLINNAVSFTPDGGDILVTWTRVPRGAVFSVRDTGIGIPRELVSRVTERFFRVDPGRSRAAGGTGLGLAIVKHVLQKHGATLNVESALGEGSTFSCQFPADRVATQRRARSAYA
jgi:two-component system phosphate regulon sensor histidine kinase PhoR